MDPIELIKPYKDSSFAMMLEAQRRGWEVHYILQSGIYAEGGTVYCNSQWISPHDPIANIQTNKIEKFFSRFFELLFRARVTLPIQYQVRGNNAAARNRCDVADIVEEFCIMQVTHNTEVIQGRAKPTTGQCESESAHFLVLGTIKKEKNYN